MIAAKKPVIPVVHKPAPEVRPVRLKLVSVPMVRGIADTYRGQRDQTPQLDVELALGAAVVHAVRGASNSLTCCAHPSKAARDGLVLAMQNNPVRTGYHVYQCGAPCVGAIVWSTCPSLS